MCHEQLIRCDSTSMFRVERMRAFSSIASPSMVNSADHGESLELLPVIAMVEYKVIRPHLVGPGGACGAWPFCCHALRGHFSRQLRAVPGQSR